MLLIFAGLASLIGLVRSFLSLHLLLNDGAFWVLSVIGNESAYRDPHYWRLTDVLVQLPAVLALHLTPAAEKVTVALRTMNVCYTFHPLLSLAFCAIYLFWKKRPLLLVFPLASFGAATMMTLGYAVGVVPEALSCFWPLALAVFLRDEKSPVELGIVLSFSVLLALSYEASLLFFALLIAFVFCSTPRRTAIPVWAALGAGFAWTLYRGLGPTVGNRQFFFTSLARPWSSVMFAAIALALTYAVTQTLVEWEKIPDRVLRRGSGAAYGAIAAWVAFACLRRPGDFRPPFAYHYRVVAIPVAGMIGAGLGAALLLAKWRNRQGLLRIERDRDLGRNAMLGAVIALAVGAAFMLKSDEIWRSAISEVTARVAQRQGCELFTWEDFREAFGRRGINAATFPYLTMLLQYPGQPHYIALVGTYPWVARSGKVIADPCERLAAGEFPEMPFPDFPSFGLDPLEFKRSLR